MKVTSPRSKHLAPPPALPSPPRPSRSALQRLGRYSLAIAIGSILPQAYPAIARSMALDEPPGSPSDLSLPDYPIPDEEPLDASVPDFSVQDGEPAPLDSSGQGISDDQEAIAPKSGSAKDLALTLDLSPPDSQSLGVAPGSEPTSDVTIEPPPEPDAESVPDAPPSDAPAQGWFAKPSPQPDADQPNIAQSDTDRDRPTPTDSFPAPGTEYPLEPLFAGGTDSLVAKAVGSAEGTRTPEGEKTWAYYGHTDPGNGVHNMGTFSYQHGASSPEEADQLQLERLKTQARQIQDDAVSRGLTLGIEEQLNAIDLANQSPKAALSYGGYLDRLQEAYQMGLRGSEAILWARVRSYLDPNTQRWNAPGLGNNLAQIEADQQRRMDAIARALMASGEPAPTDSFSFNDLPEQQVMPRSPTAQAPKRPFSGALHFEPS